MGGQLGKDSYLCFHPVVPSVDVINIKGANRGIKAGKKDNDKFSLEKNLAFVFCSRLDHTEYTCLKALVLFQPDNQGLQHQLQIEVLQDQTHIMLQVSSTSYR